MSFATAVDASVANGSPLVQALAASVLTWACTAAGAALVLVAPRLRPWMFSALLAVAAGVMLAAAFGGLLVPAWEGFVVAGFSAVPATLVGVAAGVAMSLLSHRLVQRSGRDVQQRPRLGRHLFAVMSLHHVPEGMAVGLAVSAASSGDAAAAASATLLVLAMAGHNVLEVALVSLPLRQEGASRLRAFTFRQLSDVAEVVGAGAVIVSAALLPSGLAVAAGAMLTVTLVDVMPAMRVQWHLGAALR